MSAAGLDNLRLQLERLSTGREGTEDKTCRRSAVRNVLVAFVVTGLIALARPTLPQSTLEELHERQAQKLIEYITVADPYTAWSTWPARGAFYNGRAPYAHGILMTTYVNRVARESISAAKGMAYDSIIVAENYSADKTLAGLTIMYKIDGYDPKAADWYWVETTPNARVLRFGKVQACVECHRAQAENDYIWTEEVVKGKYNKTAVP